MYNLQDFTTSIESTLQYKKMVHELLHEPNEQEKLFVRSLDKTNTPPITHSFFRVIFGNCLSSPIKKKDGRQRCVRLIVFAEPVAVKIR